VGLVLVVGALLACGAATTDQLKTRAAFDLNCSEGELQMTELDSKTRGVSGCGRRATYVESCEGAVGTVTRKCTWVMNVVTNPESGNPQSGVNTENEVASQAEKPKGEAKAPRKKATPAPEPADDEAEPEREATKAEPEAANAAAAENSAPKPAEDTSAEPADEAKKPRKKRKPPTIGY
jgi:hypothetical protein